MEVSFKTIRDRHVGLDWYPSPISLKMLGLVNNTSGEVRFSDFANPPHYIDADFNTNPTSEIIWPYQNWGTTDKNIQINANVAWEIDTMPNPNLITVKEVQGNVTFISGIEGRYGGNGHVTLRANPVNIGNTSIVFKYRDPRGYTTKTINIIVEESGLIALMYVEPPHFYGVSGEEQTLNATLYNPGGWPTADWSVGWIDDVQFTSVTQSEFTVDIYLSAYNTLCPAYPRTGVIEILADNGLVQILVEQIPQRYTPDPWGDEVVYDYNGNGYNYVTIGDYQILLQNLRIKHFADGTPITLGAWDGSDDFTVPRRQPVNPWLINPLGYFYSIATRWLGEDHGFLLPSADNVAQGMSDEYKWHIPTWNELNSMFNSAGYNGTDEGGWYSRCVGENIGNMFLFTEGNNNTGFTAIPTGYWTYHGHPHNQSNVMGMYVDAPQSSDYWPHNPNGILTEAHISQISDGSTAIELILIRHGMFPTYGIGVPIRLIRKHNIIEKK